MKSRLPRPVTPSIVALILIGWIIVAIKLDQSIFAPHKSLLLPQFGAATGDVLVTHEWWRLLVSQFLHVHFLHMLFNAACIGVTGNAIEKAYGWRVLIAVYLIGGLTGQIASVWHYPHLVTDGASQALMALCGASLVLRLNTRLKLFAGVIIVIQAALDLHAASTIKAGHGYGFAAGLLIGLGVIMATRKRADSFRIEQTR
ncbi:rhomboid family intramembrane serine protease [Undibacterium sp. TJN19]|uniref:rhomboid family intramembrane serine protease n=1 Tax=Undibacterium sp. TJN19 TaxID=3413055 RepID=UPI003BF28D9B